MQGEEEEVDMEKSRKQFFIQNIVLVLHIHTYYILYSQLSADNSDLALLPGMKHLTVLT